MGTDVTGVRNKARKCCEKRFPGRRNNRCKSPKEQQGPGCGSRMCKGSDSNEVREVRRGGARVSILTP